MLKLVFLAIIVAICASVKAFPQKNLLPETNTFTYGTITGRFAETAWTNRRFAEFLGIKYAETPSGELRFRPPVPFVPTQPEYDAREQRRPCPALSNLIIAPPNADDDIEDCLHLSVYTDLDRINTPVMVYIHGGGFTDGAASMHPPYYLMEEDIVLVVIQYRLGPLGFYSTLSEDAPGNLAILDCILALEWVQQHIEAFGGDPNSVTVFGQSAGAAIVNVLTFSPLVPANLFTRVIVQSGSIISPWTIDQNPIRHSTEIAQFANCNQINISEMNQCLRNVDVATLLTAHMVHQLTNALRGPHFYGGHLMVVGGPSGLFPTDPFDMWMSGEFRTNVSMMAGVTKHDGSFALAILYDVLYATLGVDDVDFNQFLLIDTVNRIFGVEDRTGSLTGLLTSQLFTPDEIESGDWSVMAHGLIDLASILMIKGPTFRAIQANARVNPNNTYLYTFDYEGEFTRFGYGADTSHLPFEGGIHHSDENIYLFPWPQDVANLNERDTEMAKRMVALWTSFAREGFPSVPGVPEWEPVTRISGPYLHINYNATIGEDFLTEFSVGSREARQNQTEDSYWETP